MSKLQERETAPDVYNLLLAAILFISPWLLKLTNSQGKIDLWVTSGIIVVLSLAAIIAYKDWEEWINVLMGVWLIGSRWLLGFPHTRAMHLSIGFGVAIVFLALLDLFLHYEKRHPDAAQMDSAQKHAHQ